MTPFTERPWRAAWLPRWERPLALPYLFPGVFNLQALQSLPVFSHSFPTAPFTSDLGVPPGHLGGSVRCPSFPLAWCPQFQALQSLPVFSHSFPTAPFTSDLGVPPGCLGGNLFSVVCIPFQVGGPWIAIPGPSLRRRPLTTLGRPPPTAVAESQRGEPRSRAFGTGARVAGSISLWPVLLPLVGDRVGRRRGRRGRTGVASLSSVESWLWSDAPYTLSLCRRRRVTSTDSPGLRAGGPWNAVPCLFLRRRPLTTLGRPPPTVIAESQGGELRLDAFGTGARVAGSISPGPVLLPLVSVGEEEGGVGREWQAYLSSGLSCGVTLHILALSLSSISHLRPGGPYSAVSYLFLRRRPLTTLGRPPPTAVAESQRGEPRSDAFGIGARVAGSISLWPVLLPLVGNRVGSEKRKAGQDGSGELSPSRVYYYESTVRGV
ncbi:hypothetical protein H4582DRAFT_2065661 [Lactarius indigo]|nr:hypothetical protein H4582DRAFT_2065661 [Lactarius indigo]